MSQLSVVGYVDDITETRVHGWVCDGNDFNLSLEIEIYADGVKIGETHANMNRPDVYNAGFGNGNNGFNFTFPVNIQGQKVTIRVKNYDYEIPKSRHLLEKSNADLDECVASLKQFPRRTLPHLILHYMPNGIPNIEYFLEPSEQKNQDSDIHICERLIASFNSALQFESINLPLEQRPNQGLWENLKHQFHGEICNLLQEGNPLALSEYLCNGYRENVVHGIGEAKSGWDAILSSEKDKLTLGTLSVDKLIALSEALGILPYENPEQNGRYGVNIYENYKVVARKIEQKLGIPIGRPRVFGFYGLGLDDRVIEQRTPDHLWASWRIKQIAGINKNICEIGGGFGGNCHYSYQMGCQSYTIIDLPVINVLQGYFLMKCFGEEVIQLFGEQISDRPIKIMPYWYFMLEHSEFDICFNQDSLPEMPFERAIEYLHKIPQVTRSYFYSINQEACAPAAQRLTQLNIPEIIAKIPDYKLMFRYPNWTRRGYVEELYLF